MGDFDVEGGVEDDGVTVWNDDNNGRRRVCSAPWKSDECLRDDDDDGG